MLNKIWLSRRAKIFVTCVVGPCKQYNFPLGETNLHVVLCKILVEYYNIIFTCNINLAPIRRIDRQHLVNTRFQYFAMLYYYVMLISDNNHNI